MSCFSHHELFDLGKATPVTEHRSVAQDEQKTQRHASSRTDMQVHPEFNIKKFLSKYTPLKTNTSRGSTGMAVGHTVDKRVQRVPSVSENHPTPEAIVASGLDTT
jgi:hypothetical protein